MNTFNYVKKLYHHAKYILSNDNRRTFFIWGEAGLKRRVQVQGP